MALTTGSELSNGHDMTNGRVNGTTNGHATNAINEHTVTSSCSPPKPIAICGMACRLPKGISTPQQLWEFLLAGGDARDSIPESRFNSEAFFDLSGRSGATKTQHGYFLDEDLASLDTSFFSMPGKEVERLDPQQRLMLEVARECFEDGGETGWKGKKIGCYVGSLGEDWLEMLTMDVQNYGNYRITGYGDFSLSNRVSYELDLQGPSMTIRTACSSSMVALHEACVAIGRGDCESAIVGGTNIIMRPLAMSMMSEHGVLSPDGSCKTFSNAANGYARGEAVVGVFVKPLEDAIRDRNSIRAVIRATATNHDGKTSGLSMPNPDAQEILIRRAYEVAGLPVSETAYVECHGTGTLAGDPIETKAVARVFGENGVTIGSTKPNLGHTEGASGVLSILKAVLMLENSTIPPSIKYSPKNPNIPWKSGKLSLAEEPLSWPSCRPERVSVNCFGLGGTNVHAIIDSAAGFQPVTDAWIEEEEEVPQLLLFSANNQNSLTRLVEDYKAFFEDSTSDIKDVAYTLARGREHLPFRTFTVANVSSTTAVAPSVGTPVQKKPKVAMVFTGQGAQWPQMGVGLLKSNPTFRSSIHSLDGYLKEEALPWSIEEELLKSGKKSRLNSAEFAQPLCTAVQIALVDTLRSVGIEPDAVVGHSSGEIAGGYASGALTAREAIIAALYRGIIANTLEKPGAMGAVGLGVADAEKFLIPGVCIACDNSPRNVTISGDTARVEEVLNTIHAVLPDMLARKLRVDKAYHSHHMAEVAETYNSSIELRIVAKSPKKPFFSSVENRLLDQNDKLGSRYWQKNLESPVLFNGAISTLLDHFKGQDLVFLEVGPHSALAGPLTQIMSEMSSRAKYVSTLVRDRNAIENLLAAIGKLFTYHVPIDLEALFPKGSCLPDLPRYPWARTENNLWFESRISRDYRFRKYPHHDLLGAKVIESTDIEPTWRNLLHIDHGTSWLRDHKVGNDIVFPFAGYIAIAGEAVRQTSKIEHAFRLRNVSIGAAMLLSTEKPMEVITNLRPLRLTLTQDSSWYEFTISAYNGHQWIKHCSGEVKAESSPLSIAPSSEPFTRVVGWERWFEGLRSEGLDLGYDFQNLNQITASTTEPKSQGTLSGEKHPYSLYHFHPAVLDSALQLLGVAASNGLVCKHKNFLPISCDSFFVSRTTEDVAMNVTITDMGVGSSTARTGQGQGVVNGKIAVSFDGLRIMPASITEESTSDPDPHAASRLTWASDLDFLDLGRLDGSAFFAVMSHSKPNLRVLEISNTTKSPSPLALKSFTLASGRTLWSHYTFATERSVAAEDRLDGYFNLEYVVLDIGRDPTEQDFENEPYDLVIADHFPEHCYSALRKLLTPEGRLYLRDSAAIAGLKAAEFDVSALGDATWIARPRIPIQSEINRPLSLLVRDKTKTYEVLEKVLRTQGYQTTKIILRDTPRPDVDVISLLDLDGPFLDEIAEDSYYELQNFIKNLKNSGIFWITAPCHINVKDPRYAQIIGLARVIRSELLVDFATCEIDDSTESTFALVGQVMDKFHSRVNDDVLGPEFEYAIDHGVVNIGRYYPFTLTEELVGDSKSERINVTVGSSGRLSDLRWVRRPAPLPLVGNELEIEIHAVGINFKDILVSMNIISHVERSHGFEGAGIVRRVGPQVKNLKVGDRVSTLWHNVLTTYLITQEVACAKLPDCLSFTDAATMFTAYATVQQSLINVGRLQEGDSLLIHSACGGVGLAAIQLAKMLGADVYATVGSEEKVKYLVENWGIPRNRIFNSRNNSFVDGVYRETNGKGVDLALNSLSGELLHETWKCIAPFGKLVEIGKRELIGHGRLDMEPFVANRSYCCIDIDGYYGVANYRFGEMMRETLGYLGKGLIKPIVIAKEYDASSITEAFQYLLPGTHIGRVCIRIRDENGKPTLRDELIDPAPWQFYLDPEASYLLVGGLGGLGRSIATFMVEHGARNLIFFGRSAGQKPGDQAFISELGSMGARVLTFRGDVTNFVDVSNAVNLAPRRLRGILQLSNVLADENFSRLSRSQWSLALGPKVTGTWNLHRATEGLSLDFFLLSSSLSSAIGTPGQANYSAANTFLDAFVQYRNNLGLACTSIDIGAVAEAGMLAGSPDLLRTVALVGNKTVKERELLDAVALAMLRPKPSSLASAAAAAEDDVVTVPFSDPNVFVLGLTSSRSLPLADPSNRAIWKRDRRMAIYHNSLGSSASSGSSLDGASDQLKAFLARARTEPSLLKAQKSATLLARIIGKKLFGLLLKPDDSQEVNTDLALADLGLDSLVAVELRAWWKVAFGFEISVLEMLGMGNLEGLGELVAKKLRERFEEEGGKK